MRDSVKGMIAIGVLVAAGAAIWLDNTGGFESKLRETDFQAFGARAAADRSGEFSTCELLHKRVRGSDFVVDKPGFIRCMESKGYSYQPR